MFLLIKKGMFYLSLLVNNILKKLKMKMYWNIREEEDLF